MPKNLGVPGQAPREAAVNFNDRVLDSVRAALGIPRSFAFGLVVPPVIQPVVIIDPDSPPVLQSKGIFGRYVGPIAANFSVVAFQNIGGAGGILKVWARIINGVAAVQGFNLRVCQGAVDTYTVAGNGFTEVVVPSADSRYNPAGGSGVAKWGQRTTLPGAWAPPGSVLLVANNVGVGTDIRLGPLFLDQFDAVTVESGVVNQEVNVLFEWEYYAPVR